MSANSAFAWWKRSWTAFNALQVEIIRETSCNSQNQPKAQSTHSPSATRQGLLYSSYLHTDRWQALHPHLLYPPRSTCFSLSLYLQSPIIQWTSLPPSPPHWGPFIIKPTTWLNSVCCNHRQPRRVIDVIQTFAARFTPDKCHSPHAISPPTWNTPLTHSFCLSFSTVGNQSQL